MYLSDFDLQQLNEQELKKLPAAQKEALLVKLLWDLQEARERLKANSQTSSRPPSSDLPWQGRSSERQESEEGESVSAEDEVPASGESDEERADASAEPAEETGPRGGRARA